jgi:hypothetical protein
VSSLGVSNFKGSDSYGAIFPYALHRSMQLRGPESEDRHSNARSNSRRPTIPNFRSSILSDDLDLLPESKTQRVSL